jgi:antitoxin VapB
MPALNIKDPEVLELAAQLPQRTGQSMSEAVKEALRESIDRHRSRPTDKESVTQRVMEIAKRIAALPVLDPRSPDEIIGYNEHGVPE